MTLLLGDIGYQQPLDYLYSKDMEHPSSRKCYCGRLLHTVGSTSAPPLRWIYGDYCVYHDNRLSTIIYSSGGNRLEYNKTTGQTRNLGLYSPLLDNGALSILF